VGHKGAKEENIFQNPTNPPPLIARSQSKNEREGNLNEE
jgi:hypothetical protein